MSQRHRKMCIRHASVLKIVPDLTYVRWPVAIASGTARVDLDSASIVGLNILNLYTNSNPTPPNIIALNVYGRLQTILLDLGQTSTLSKHVSVSSPVGGHHVCKTCLSAVFSATTYLETWRQLYFVVTIDWGCCQSMSVVHRSRS